MLARCDHDQLIEHWKKVSMKKRKILRHVNMQERDCMQSELAVSIRYSPRALFLLYYQIFWLWWDSIPQFKECGYSSIFLLLLNQGFSHSALFAFGDQYFLMEGDPIHYRMLRFIPGLYLVMNAKMPADIAKCPLGVTDIPFCDNMLILRSTCQFVQSSLLGFSQGLH